MKTVLARCVGSAALALACAPALAVSHVFLVQNSGWMEPFYSDPASQYKPLVSALVMAVHNCSPAMRSASTIGA